MANSVISVIPPKDSISYQATRRKYGNNAHLELQKQPGTTYYIIIHLVLMIPFPDYAQSTIDTLHENGKYVVCYISIGSWEEWREDADDFPAEMLGQPLELPWKDERWLDINNEVNISPQKNSLVYSLSTARWNGFGKTFLLNC